MELINRKNYTEKIENIFGKGLIIALTGQRRVGKSFIMKQIIKDIEETENPNIIYIDLDREIFSNIKTHNELSEYINSHLDSDKNNYVFIDEVQNVLEFEKTLRSLHTEDSCNIMITGSNAKMLSSELSTFLSGRCIEYHIQSLSYEEFIEFHKLDDNEQNLLKYLDIGGLPQIYRIGLENNDLIQDYLSNIYNTIVLKDIIEREDIRNTTLLKNLAKFVADNIGKQISTTSIVKFLKGQQINTTVQNIQNYLEYFCNAFIINKVPRYDIHGRKLFEINDKFYFEDLGIRNHLAGHNRASDIEKVMENVIYLHLKRLGYEIYIGQLQKAEIDFVVRKNNNTAYIQVTYLLASEDTINREFGNLKLINDNHPKYVVSMDRMFPNINEDGIKHIQLHDFLKMEEI